MRLLPGKLRRAKPGRFHREFVQPMVDFVRRKGRDFALAKNWKDMGIDETFCRRNAARLGTRAERFHITRNCLSNRQGPADNAAGLPDFFVERLRGLLRLRPIHHRDAVGVQNIVSLRQDDLGVLAIREASDSPHAAAWPLAIADMQAFGGDVPTVVEG